MEGPDPSRSMPAQLIGARSGRNYNLSLSLSQPNQFHISRNGGPSYQTLLSLTIYIQLNLGYFDPDRQLIATVPFVLDSGSFNPHRGNSMIVEKAFAKLHGSWESIGHGGRIAAALEMLTGGTARTMQTNNPDRVWKTLQTAVNDPNILVGAGEPEFRALISSTSRSSILLTLSSDTP